MLPQSTYLVFPSAFPKFDLPSYMCAHWPSFAPPKKCSILSLMHEMIKENNSSYETFARDIFMIKELLTLALLIVHYSQFGSCIGSTKSTRSTIVVIYFLIDILLLLFLIKSVQTKAELGTHCQRGEYGFCKEMTEKCHVSNLVGDLRE